MKKGELKKQPREGKNERKGLADDSGLSQKMWKIFDIPLFSGDRRRVLSVLDQKIDSGTKKYWVATVNPEFVMAAEKDKSFKQILTKTNLNVVDGIGLVWARELANQPISSSAYQIVKFLRKLSVGFKVGVKVLRGKYKNQVASGADLILELAKMAKEKNKKIFLLGGWGDRAEKTARNFQFSNSNLQCDWSAGEPEVANSEVIKKINSFKPDILLVAYGMKKQEFWIDENLKNLDVGLVVGVGRSFDYYSGDLKRAPKWVRKMGLEWLYSLIKEPARLKRQLVLPKFVWKVMRG